MTIGQSIAKALDRHGLEIAAASVGGGILIGELGGGVWGAFVGMWCTAALLAAMWARAERTSS